MRVCIGERVSLVSIKCVATSSSVKYVQTAGRGLRGGRAMCKMTKKSVQVLLALVAGLSLLSVSMAGLAAPDGATAAKTLDRDLEPVIVAGWMVSDLSGSPTDELFVYAYSGGSWEQIPAQVDEVAPDGSFSSYEDGALDANDEIVFMAKDTGEQAPADPPLNQVLTIGDKWYEIVATDPLEPTHQAWAYLVRSAALTATVPIDYVDFDAERSRINAQTYSVGFALTHPALGYGTLGGGGASILDRTKVHLMCDLAFICPLNEDDLYPRPDGLVKDGPVRVIAREGRVLAYGSMTWWAPVFDIPQFLAGDVRISTDFRSTAIGSTLYSAVVPDGVTVDGEPDTVPPTPLSTWWQLSTPTGTVIRVADSEPAGGTPSNFYVDNQVLDPRDTGDHRHYGETGISIEDPDLKFTYVHVTYFLPDSQPNIGATFAGYFFEPIIVEAFLQQSSVPDWGRLYLPLVRQEAGA